MVYAFRSMSETKRRYAQIEKKSHSSDLGMSEVHWLHLRAEVSDWRPQGIDTTSEHQTAGQYATTNSGGSYSV